MDQALWVVEGILAFVFFALGCSKLVLPRQTVLAGGFEWSGDLSTTAIRLIGAVELLAAVGVIVPRLMKHGHYTTPVSAGILVLLMLVAAYSHIRRQEYHLLAVNLILLFLSLFLTFHTIPGVN